MKTSRLRDHWTFLSGQIALASFLVVLATGVFLAVFYDPDMKQVVYNGSYVSLRDVPVSRAFESTVQLSLDVRAGLLMRQIHRWAALILPAAICCQLLRMFFTGAFRRPRVANWLIWVALLVLTMAAGVTGGLLPDDMLSGGSLGLIQSITQAIPVIGTRLMLWIFGGEVTGEVIIPRLAMPVPALTVPGAFFTLLAAYPWLERRFTGDSRPHDLLDRPREAGTRTAIGAAGITFYALLWAAAANDQIAVTFHLPLFAVTWFFRIAVLLGPLLAFDVTRRICLGLTDRERQALRNGTETGAIVMDSAGGFSEVHVRANCHLMKGR
ncbi:cytochrome b N-terminal domain-containing protein [Microtetraspora fusca]|uniref:Cytochrome bc1 complex cytochrome b subunit n=1 Tax=Microtetraspora fusca TaxID=1997 RepID=A0ABW6VEN1_MICFU